MPVFCPKTHLTSFRLTEEEYSRLEYLSKAQGARSLADFIRISLCRMMDRDLAPPPDGCAAREADDRLESLLLALQHRTDRLDQEVRSLANLLRASGPRDGAIGAGPSSLDPMYRQGVLHTGERDHNKS
jgi:hypothetical protein